LGIKSKVMGIVMSIVLIVIALILLPVSIDAVHDVVTDRVVAEAFPGQVVAAGETAFIIAHPLYRDSMVSVVALTATGGGAVPVAHDYIPASRTLTLNGMGVDTPQNVTVTYDWEANAAFNGVNAILTLIPLLIVVGLIIVAVINGLWALKHGE
jgi:hypothetical protein